MAEIQRLTYQIAPASKRNHLTDAKYIQGGYIAVKDLEELKTLPIVEYNEDGTIKKDGVIVKGSMAYAWAENKIYIYEEPPLSNIPEWIWKDFGGGAGSTYSTTTPTNVTVGGIASGTTIKDATITDMFDFLLHKEIDPVFNSLVSAPTVAGTYEYGTKCSVTSITPTYTNGSDRTGSVSPVSYITATDNFGNTLFSKADISKSGVAMPLVDTIELDGTKNYSISATITDSCTPTPHSCSKTLNINFNKYIYYGVSSDPDTIPTTLIRTKYACGSNMSNDLSISVQNNQYIWLLTADTNMKLQQYAVGQWNNISTTTKNNVTIKLDSNVDVVYNAYRSDKMSASTGYYRVTKK